MYKCPCVYYEECLFTSKEVLCINAHVFTMKKNICSYINLSVFTSKEVLCTFEEKTVYMYVFLLVKKIYSHANKKLYKYTYIY